MVEICAAVIVLVFLKLLRGVIPCQVIKKTVKCNLPLQIFIKLDKIKDLFLLIAEKYTFSKSDKN